ncbi:response regulator [Novosphingobium sp. M1R2S20]|uniref:Response regulator n=1 Tax=Novosphingobium rhizovicinum TaxID=3228928 RepID=A0ABV3RAI0_9SPHN
MFEDPEPEDRPLNLLIVEDEALIAMLIEDALTLHGHTIVGTADNVQEAIALGQAGDVDLALCDVRLAQGDSGVDAAVKLAELGIPVIYLSGNCPGRADHRLILGCVSKPFHTAALHKSVVAAHSIAAGAAPPMIPTALTLYS